MNRLALINAVLRLAIRPLWARSLSAKRMRRAFAFSDWAGALGRAKPVYHPEQIGGVAVEWLGPRDAAAGGVLVFVHGGSFSLRCERSERLLCADMAQRSGLPVALVDYRLAPEFPYPAALDDCTRVYEALIARGIAPERMVFFGHSAGANLIAAMLMRVRDAGLPQPAGAVLLSGPFDLTGPSAAALAMEQQDVCATPAIWTWTCHQYLGGMDPAQPGASPWYGDWRGLAPLQFHVSDSELLYDSVKASTQRARAAGVDATLTVWPGASHFYPALDMLEDTRRCRAQIAAFAQEVLRRTPAPQPAADGYPAATAFGTSVDGALPSFGDAAPAATSASGASN